MSNQIFHFSNLGISSGQRFYLKDDVSGIFVRNLNIDSNFPVIAPNLVYTTGDQDISGVKNFSSRPTVNGSGVLLVGETGSVVLPNTLVYTTGDQDISGVKNFSSRPTVNGSGVLLVGETGSVVLPNTLVYTTGDQDISGNKNFLNNIGVSGTGTFNAIDLNNIDTLSLSGVNISIVDGAISLTNRPNVNGTGVLLIGETASVVLPNTLVYTTGDQTISGVKTFIGNTNISGNLNVTGNIFLSGNPVLTGSNHTHLWSQSIYDSQAGGAGGGFAGRSGGGNLFLYAGTQSTSVPSFYGWDGFLNTSFTAATARTNLELTSTATAVENTFVRTTGDQRISGIKTFAENAVFGDPSQGDFLVISGNTFTIYGSGNFTSGLFVNGNAVLTGVDLSSYATIANLALTGSTLDTKINNLSGVSVLTFGNQTIAGNKNFLNNINISGNVDVTGRVVASTGIFGLNNNISGLWLTMPGGSGNIIAANHSVINGGQDNRLSGNFSVIGGGRSNFIAAGMSNDFSVIGGGFLNIVCAGGASYGATIGGGCFNVASDQAAIGGGLFNKAVGTASFIGGGSTNCAAGRNSFIGGGSSNCALCCSSVVGGFGNYACSVGSSIAGGGINTICGGEVRADFSVIGGGRNNTIGDLFPVNMGWTTIAGGFGNKISSSVTAYASTIGGGESNCISNAGCSIIAGGFRNCICSIFSTIGGGECNCAFGDFSFVGGGKTNFSSGIYSSTVGGFRSRACGDYNFVGGGSVNCAIIGGCASVVGGKNNRATGAASFIGGGGINTAGGLYSSTVGGVLNNVQACNAFIGGGESNCAFGDYSFVGGGRNNTIVLGAFAGFIGGGSSNTLGGTYSSTIGGYMSTIGGGRSNTVSGEGSAILGGESNSAFGECSAIIGGQGNINCGRASVIGGGNSNCILGPSNSTVVSFIGGGASNRIYRNGGSIPGGQANLLSGSYSATLGGFGNEIYSEYSFAIGGRRACVLRNHDGAGILGDGQNRDHGTSGCHSLVIDFASGVYFASPQIYGSLIFNSPVNAINGLTANSGLDLNNSNLINATPQIINLSSNFNISGDYNSRMIMVNSANEVTGTIISGNSLGFNATIMQVGVGQVLITGSGIGINIGSYNNQYRTAGKFAAVSVLHTGTNGYTIYGNTAV